MANQCGRAQRCQCRLGCLSAGVRCPSGGLPNFRTSELPNALPLWARLLRSVPSGVFFAQTGRRWSAAKKLGDDAVLQQSAPFLLRWSRPHRGGKTGIGEDIARGGAFRQHRHCVLPRGLTRARRRRATFANQLRGVVAFAESPWPLTRTKTGAEEKSARCAILAGSPWEIFPAC